MDVPLDPRDARIKELENILVEFDQQRLEIDKLLLRAESSEFKCEALKRISDLQLTSLGMTCVDRDKLKHEVRDLNKKLAMFESMLEIGFAGAGHEVPGPNVLSVSFDEESESWVGQWFGILSAGETREEAIVATVSAVVMQLNAERCRDREVGLD
jgi:hypothetical protein